MKVTWFDQGFAEPELCGKSRSLDLARALVDAGHEVTIVNTRQHVRDDVLALSSGLIRRDRRSGSITIVEFDLLLEGSALTRLAARLRYFAALVRLAVRRGADLCVSTSESRAGQAAVLIARVIRGRPFVIDARSVRSRIDSALRLRRPLSIRFTELLEKAARRASNKIITASDDLTRAIIHFGKVRHKVETIANATDRAPFQVAAPMPLSSWFSEPPDRDSLVVVYAGRIDVVHGLGALLDAADTLAERGRSDISFLIVGDGPRRSTVADTVRARRLKHVYLADSIEENSFPAFLKSCDVGLVLANPNPTVHAYFEPANFTAYLAARLPVIVNYPGSVAGTIVRSDVGIAVRAGDPAAFADCLELLADDRAELARMAKNAANVDPKYNDAADQRSTLVSALETVVVGATARRGQLFKRCVDASVAATLLALLSPLLATLALAIRLGRGAPVIVRDLRPGLFGRQFELLRLNAGEDDFLSGDHPRADEPRSTLFGRLLNSRSVINLPHLWNVLRGDISLVGPPLMSIQDLTHLSGRELRRLYMRPGLIGPAQVGMRVDGGPLATDLWYAANHSTKLDLEILARHIFRKPKRESAELSRTNLSDGNEPGWRGPGRPDSRARKPAG